MTQTKLVGYTVSEAARELDVTVQQIYRWLNRKTLVELPVKGKARLVDADSVAALKRERELAAEVG